MMKKYFSLALILGFLLIISFPNLSWVLGIQSITENLENRTMAPFPNLNQIVFSKLPEAIMAYYNDNFGFRSRMIRLNQIIRYDYLGVAPKNIFHGKKGWDFLNTFDVKVPTATYKTILFTDAELRSIKNKMEEDDQFFHRLQIPYFNVVVPDKEVIYPEFYPYPEHILTNFRLDQLIDYLEANSSSRLLDLRQLLIAGKGKNQLYYIRDTHWNYYGSFLFYQDIMRRLSLIYPNVYVPELSDFNIEPNDSGVTPNKSFAQIKKLKSVFIYGDSFAGQYDTTHNHGLARFLSFSFENVNLQNFRSPLEYSRIEKEKPDLVIRENVQRNLRILLGADYSIF